MKDQVNQLFQEQLSEWDLAKNNYKALELVKVKTLYVNGQQYQVQFNPARMISSSARVDAQSISERKCFLCAENRPAEQKGIPFEGRYTILVNPYPIFPRHLTIPSLEHTPQQIASRFGDMLDLAQQLDDYTILYNGSKCGASAPDHFHFQAGNKGFLPIENNRNWRHTIRIESDNRSEMFSRFEQTYNSLSLQPDDIEPMVNILTWYENRKSKIENRKSEMWTCCIFPRKKHRPACYFAEGDANMLISPAVVDMGGVLITPMEKDFEKITADDIAGILDETQYFPTKN